MEITQLKISNEIADIKNASHIILPGVGAFGDCISGLNATNLIPTLEEEVLEKKKPFLGICVGMQLLAENGFEKGEHKGLGWIKGKVDKIQDNGNLRIPHMGWNGLKFHKKHFTAQDVQDNKDVYFVHSYRFFCDAENIIASTEYGAEIPAIIARENIVGFQFHPEKSQDTGIKLIENFIRQKL